MQDLHAVHKSAVFSFTVVRWNYASLLSKYCSRWPSVLVLKQSKYHCYEATCYTQAESSFILDFFRICRPKQQLQQTSQKNRVCSAQLLKLRFWHMFWHIKMCQNLSLRSCAEQTQFILKRATFCNHRESPDNFNFFELFIISPKIPFDELFLKTTLKTSGDI